MLALFHFAMHILFADDNPQTCELFDLVFRKEGVCAHIAHSGIEAVEFVKAERVCFDAIVLDVEMPYMDGWTAFENIRQLPQGQCVPIVIFTGYATSEANAHALQLGAAAFLIKPLLPQDLLKELHTIIEKQHLGPCPQVAD